MSRIRAAITSRLTWLAGNVNLRRIVEEPQVTTEAMKRYIAGVEPSDAIDVVRELTFKRRRVTLTRLLAPPENESELAERVQAYADLVATLQRAQLTADDACELGFSLHSLGWHSLGGVAAQAAAATIVDTAAHAGVLVTVEPATGLVDETLDLVRRLRTSQSTVGVTLQAGLRRTAADCRDFSEPGSRVRLLKGYFTDEDDTFSRNEDVDRSFARCARVLLEGPGYPILGTHDIRLLRIASALADYLDRPNDSYEFQMRYGVRPEMQAVIADRGDRLRVYVPYGPDWYPYFLGRLADQPSNYGSILRAALGR